MLPQVPILGCQQAGWESITRAEEEKVMTEAAGREPRLDRRGIQRRSSLSESLLPPGRTDLSQTQAPKTRPQSKTTSPPSGPELFATSLAGSAPCPPPGHITLACSPEPPKGSTCPGVRAGGGVELGSRAVQARPLISLAISLTAITASVAFLTSNPSFNYIGAGCFFLLPVFCLITGDEPKSQTSKLIPVAKLPFTLAVNTISVLRYSHRYITGQTYTVLALKKLWYRLEM